MKKYSIFILFCCFVLSYTIVAHAIPQYINYQGVLRDSSGNLVTGSKAMTFKIYDAVSGGTEKFTMTSPEVSVNNGLYNVQLGPLGFAEMGTGRRWLEVIVAGETLLPRLEILSVAYAVTAASAEAVGGYAPAFTGANIIPVTNASGELSSTVIPSAGVNVNHADTADYSTLSGQATNAASSDTATNADNADAVDGISASTEATADQLLALDSNKILKGATISAEANSNNFALLVVGRIGATSAGTGEILSTESSVEVFNAAVTNGSVILLTLRDRSPSATIGKYLKILSKNQRVSFKVGTHDNAATSSYNIPFNYLIIN